MPWLLMHIAPGSKVAVDTKAIHFNLHMLIFHPVTSFSTLHFNSRPFYPGGQDILRELFLIFYLLGAGMTK